MKKIKNVHLTTKILFLKRHFSLYEKVHLITKVIESSAAIAVAELTLCILQQHSRERSLMKRLLTGLNHMLVQRAFFHFFAVLPTLPLWPKPKIFTQSSNQFWGWKFSTNWRRRHYVQVWPKLKFCNFFKNCQKSGTLCLLN